MNVTKLMRNACEKKKIEQKMKVRIHVTEPEKTGYKNRIKKDDKRRRPIRGRLRLLLQRRMILEETTTSAAIITAAEK